MTTFTYNTQAVKVSFDKLETWEEVITAAQELRQQGDRVKWELGDLVLEKCLRATGRPANAEEAVRTVSALAQAIGEQRSMLSHLANNSDFYPRALRKKIPPQVSWRQCAEARKLSGWKPGTPITDKHRTEAMKAITQIAELSPKRSGGQGIEALVNKALHNMIAAEKVATPKERPYLSRAKSILVSLQQLRAGGKV